mmetsp:Transcript_39438/g.77622  ORF Transcript_39438/g.77622 Transcript_39438/m.77622 type:complete len:101 (-) Transcript_39438:295-597(-)
MREFHWQETYVSPESLFPLPSHFLPTRKNAERAYTIKIGSEQPNKSLSDSLAHSRTLRGLALLWRHMHRSLSAEEAEPPDGSSECPPCISQISDAPQKTV